MSIKINTFLYEKNSTFQATDLQEILDNAKMPASRTLQAAHAYEMIVKAVTNSTEAAEQAKEVAENAASMVSLLVYIILRIR